MTDSKPPGFEPPTEARRPFGALVRELFADGALLVRQEIALARAEVRQSVAALGRNSGMVAGGAVLAVVGALVLVLFLVIGLGVLLGREYWLSSLIVGVLLLGGGVGVIVLGARKLAKGPIVPTQAAERLWETGEWAGAEMAGVFGSVAGDGRSSSGALRDGAAEHRRAPAAASDRTGPRAGGEGVALHPRGRLGTSPPLPVSEPIYKRVFHELRDDDVPGQGARLAYFMFTSMPPALLVLFALTGFFGGEQTAAFISAQLQGALPGSADDPESAAGFVSEFVDQVARERAPGSLTIGLVVGLWAASNVFVAITESLNLAYDVQEERSWFKRRAMAIAVMIGFLVLFLGGSMVLLAGPQIAAAIELSGAMDLFWSIAQWPLAFLLVVGAFFLVYYFLPNRQQGGCRGVLFKSSAVAAGLWLLASLAFRIYIANFGSYGETYGFVGAILVLLLWLYLTGMVILVGGEVSSEMLREAEA